MFSPLFDNNFSIPSEKFFSLGILGQNNQIEQYFPKNKPEIQINQSMEWNIYLSNNYDEAKYLAIYVKLLNETMNPPNTIACSPSSSPILYSKELIVLKDQEMLLPFNWSLIEYEITDESIIINDLLINDELMSGLNINGNRFRIIFELWVFNENTSEFTFNWYDADNVNHCSWNQIWFYVRET
jgi:hypothetical protein